MAKFNDRATMIGSVNTVTGTDNCSEAVLVWRRSLWPVLAVFIAVFGVLILLILAGLHPLAASPIASVLGAVAASYTFRYFVLARTGADVVLFRAKRWSSKATSTEWSRTAPVEAEFAGGLLSNEFILDKTSYYLRRSHVERANAVLR